MYIEELKCPLSRLRLIAAVGGFGQTVAAAQRQPAFTLPHTSYI